MKVRTIDVICDILRWDECRSLKFWMSGFDSEVVFRVFIP